MIRITCPDANCIVSLYIKEDIADRATIKIVSSSRSVNTFIHSFIKRGK